MFSCEIAVLQNDITCNIGLSRQGIVAALKGALGLIVAFVVLNVQQIVKNKEFVDVVFYRSVDHIVQRSRRFLLKPRTLLK